MKLTVKDTCIRAIKVHGEDYISLTDIAKLKILLNQMLLYPTGCAIGTP